MKLISIVAVSNNDVIGINGSIPWKLPADMKMFKEVTSGHAIVMGRKTWESIGRRPLPGRLNIVLSSQTHEELAGNHVDFVVVTSLNEAMNAAHDYSYDKLFVVGGEALYEEAAPYVDEIYLTKVDAVVQYTPLDRVAHFKWYPDTDNWTLERVQSFDPVAGLESELQHYVRVVL